MPVLDLLTIDCLPAGEANGMRDMNPFQTDCTFTLPFTLGPNASVQDMLKLAI